MAGENSNMPWSLIGISDEARRRVRVAAAENDQTIGQWLNDRILEAAEAQNGRGSGAEAGPTGSATRAILTRIDRFLADAESFSTEEIAAFRQALEHLALRLDDLETLSDWASQDDLSAR